MQRRYLTRLGIPVLAAVTAIGLVSSALAQSATIIIAPSAPPPPRVETVPPPPSINTQVLTWQAGHWAWDGTNWAWVEGGYVQRPQPTAQWEPGHWEQQTTGAYVWVDGHWAS